MIQTSPTVTYWLTDALLLTGGDAQYEKKNLTYNSFLFRKCYRHNGSELNDQFYILACRLQRLQDNKKEQKNFMHGTLQEFLFLF